MTLHARVHASPSAQLQHNLTNHKPGFDQIAKIERIRSWAKALGELIIEEAPESRERSLAITNLEQTVMWAVASVARAAVVPDIPEANQTRRPEGTSNA